MDATRFTPLNRFSSHVNRGAGRTGTFELLVAWWLEDIARESKADDRLGGTGLVEALAGGRIAREVAA
jgi:hypothetical protein